ncbi:MAG: PP2C family protein-serine/threonine phosphatase [Treponema sp.]|nr:PP2C family protein-serine/threonine phosphatase [Treponema sp.]
MSNKGKKLSRSLGLAIILFTVFLSASLGLFGYGIFYTSMISKYQDYEKTVLNLAVADFNWDAINDCIKNGREDENFKKLRDRLDFVKSNTEIAWIYMLIPLNVRDKDNMRYVCTGNTPEDYENYKKRNEEPVQLGKLTGTEFPADVANKYLDFFQRSKPGDFWYYPNNTEWGYVYTTSIVIRDSLNTPICVLSVDINMTDIDRTVLMYPIVILLAAIVFGSIFLLILTLWLKKRIITPLSKLKSSAADFVEKANGQDVESLNFTDPQIKTKDEIESLSTALVKMASGTKEYMEKLLIETTERERISADLNVASQIQADMLPHIFPGFPERTDFELYASMNPAKEVGGDFYDFFMIDNDHIGLVMADVSGKGIPAALFMVIAKTIIKNRALSGNLPSPSQVLHDANNQLCEGNKAGLFVTTWFGILDLNTGLLTATNAGHEYPAIRHGSGKYELLKDKHALPLAAMEDTVYKDYEIQLEKGASIFLYTDGIPEATNGQLELYGEERLVKALNKDPLAKPPLLLPSVKKDVDEFVGAAPQFDDLTMLALSYYGR